MLRHPAGQHVALCEQRGAAVMIDHALGIAGRAGGIVERDRVPLVVRHKPSVSGVAGGDQLLVFDPADARPRPAICRVFIVDDQRLRLGERKRFAHNSRVFAIDDENLCLCMVEREGQNRRVKPRVECV